MRLLHIIGLAALAANLNTNAWAGEGDSIPSRKVPSSFLRSTFYNEDINRPELSGKSIRFGGMFRQNVDFSNMSDPWGGLDGTGVYSDNTAKNLFIGDDNEFPNFRFRMDASTEGGAGYGTEFYMYTPWTGQFDDKSLGQNQGVNAYGMWGTEYGNYGIRLGGQYWYELTPLTLSSSGQSAFNRSSLFQRQPFEGVNDVVDSKYSGYYQGGSYDADFRWNYRPFHGVILGGWDMPWKLGIEAFYGRTNYNNGPLTSQVPNLVRGGRIHRDFGKVSPTHIGVTYMNHVTYEDSVNLQESQQMLQIGSVDFEGRTMGIRFYGEVAFSEFTGLIDQPFIEANPTFEDQYLNTSGDSVVAPGTYDLGHAIRAGIHTPKQLTFLPLQIDFWRASSTFFSPNGIVNNASMANAFTFGDPNATITADQRAAQIPGTGLFEVGQMSNNRQGVNLNTIFDVVGVKAGVNWSMATEIDAKRSSPIVNYGKRVNGLQFKNMYRWGRGENFGPYGQNVLYYRGISEQIQLTDTLSNGWYNGRKNFSNLEASLKYYLTPFGKDLYMFYNFVSMSTQEKASPLPKFGEGALVNHTYHEFESFLTLTKSLVACLYIGYESNTGNSKTVVNRTNGATYTDANPFTENDLTTAIQDLNDGVITQAQFDSLPSLKTMNQKVQGIGFGLDVNLGQNAGLYLRHRWFAVRDENFYLNNMKGTETTAELRILF